MKNLKKIIVAATLLIAASGFSQSGNPHVKADHKKTPQKMERAHQGPQHKHADYKGNHGVHDAKNNHGRKHMQKRQQCPQHHKPLKHNPRR